ncbi:MAG: fimbria/pilus periplasmic chaperone [Gammaproteobacteria bacterium]|nr:fimbria/pilus periplasmic chaperone [Gammaproteobacteria bacterium]
MRIHTVLAGLLALLLAQATSAQVSVSRSVINFKAGEQIQDFDVLNTADHKIWLSLQASEIIDPTSATSRKVELNDPRTADVLVTPSRLLLPPGQQKRIRVIMRNPAGEKERIFRLAVLPHTGRISLADNAPAQLSGGIKVLLGYELLLISRPENPTPEIQARRRDDSVEFINTGNTNVMLQRISQCFAVTGDCLELPTKRLYPGESLTVAIDPQSVTPWAIETVQADGDGVKTVVY